MNGSIDLVWGSGVLAPEDLVELDGNQTNDLFVIYSDDINNVIILLNSGKAPLDDINIRKTIIHAIDKKQIIDDQLSGIFKLVDNVFPLNAPYSDVALTPRWDYDLEKAEFLNCPEPADRSLALGLGLDLGLLSVGLLGLAIFYVRRSKNLEAEFEGFLFQKEAISA